MNLFTKIFLFSIITILSCACSSTKPTPTSSLKEDRQIFTVTLAQKKLLNIVKQQEVFFAAIQKKSKMTQSDIYSAQMRIKSMWEEYFVDNPNDIDALIIYGKFLRIIGDDMLAYEQFSKVEALSGNIAVVKQQLANYEAENGMPNEALTHLREAVLLDNDNSVYYQQLAELILVYRDEYIRTNVDTQKNLDDEMISAYRKLAKLNPKTTTIQWSYARAFYDLGNADWNEALAQWDNILEHFSPLYIDREMALVNKARVLIELYKDDQARDILNNIKDESLTFDKLRLLEIIDASKSRGDSIQN